MTGQADFWNIGETTAPLAPKARGALPWLGHALKMRSDPTRYLVDLYQEYGPIYRIQVLDRETTVMAGLAANRFTTQHDDEVFTNEIEFRGLRQEIGPAFTSAAPDEHRYMRRLLRAPYGKSAAAPHLGTMVRVVNEYLDRLRPGESFTVFPLMQEIVVNQLGYMMFGLPAGEYFEDFRKFMLSLLEVYQFRMKPERILKQAGYQRAKSRAREMAQKVLAHVRSLPPGEARPAGSIDLLMQSEDMHGQPFDEAYLMSEAMAPYLAGQDTVAGTMSFICYALHKFPGVLERVQADARENLGTEIPRMDELRRLDVVHKAIVETMRRFPVATAMPRHAARQFEFAGYRVDAGMHVYSATTVTHFLPEYYEDPYAFNIDRPRGPSGTYAPFGVGNYACLGAGIAEVQLLVTTAAILRYGRFELDPPDFKARMSTIPLPNPGRLRLKLIERY